MQDGLGNRGQGARGPRWQRLNHRLQRRTLNSRRLNTPSDLSPPLSCSRKAGVLATFSPSRSLTSEEPLILNELPGPQMGDGPSLANSQAAVRIEDLCVKGLVQVK